MGRGTQSPVDEHFHRGGSRGSAEWGKSSQSKDQTGSLTPDRSGVMVHDSTNQQPWDMEAMDTAEELANHVGVFEPTLMDSSNDIICTTEEEIALASVVEGSVKQALAAEFLSDNHHGYQFSADVEDGIYDAATEYITEVDPWNIVENTAEPSSPETNDVISDQDAVTSDCAAIATEDDDDPDLGKEGQPLVKLPESAVKTGPALVKSPPAVTTVTNQACVTSTTTVTTATETMATASHRSPPVVVSSTAGTRMLQGTSLMRGLPGVPVHHVAPVPVRAPPGAMFPAAMSPVMPHLSHQMASRHAAIAAAAASAAVTAMKMHATGGQHPRLPQPAAAAPTVNVRTITGQPVIRAGTATGQPVIRAGTAMGQRVIRAGTAPRRSMSPGHAVGTPLVHRHAGLISPPDTTMVRRAVVPTSAHSMVPPTSHAALVRQVVPRPSSAHQMLLHPVTYTQSPNGVVTSIRHVKRPSYDACYQHSYKVRAYSPV